MHEQHDLFLVDLRVHLGLHPLLKVRVKPAIIIFQSNIYRELPPSGAKFKFKPGVVLPHLGGAFFQGERPQHRDAGVHHVVLAVGVDLHLRAAVPDQAALGLVQGAVLALGAAQGPVAPGARVLAGL